MTKNIPFQLKQKIKRKLNKGFPACIEIEPTNHCNLNCPFCLVGAKPGDNTSHHSMKRERTYMDINLYIRILDEGTAMGLMKILLHLQGEPLLHPQITDMVTEAKKRFLYCSMFTNGQLITEQLAKGLVAAKLDAIRFSVDGTDEEVYQQNRPGGTFKKVHENMKIMAETARGTDTRIIWQFIPLRNNEHQIPIAENMAKESGVEFLLKSFAETNVNLTTYNVSLRRKLRTKPCTDIYRQFVVLADGKVVPCCYDVEGTNILGDLNHQSLREIWFSEKFRDFHSRIANIRNCPESEPELCRHCLKWTLPKN